jgi:hypothetical protein
MKIEKKGLTTQPTHISKEQRKDNDFSRLKPPFDFIGSSIGIEDLKDETERLTNHVSLTEDNLVEQFPCEAFPLALQQIIKATNECLNFPVDFIGASMLYAASIAIGNTYKVQVKKGFQESAVLYLAIVGRAGTNKSHPLSFALQPIVEQDKKTYKLYEEQRLQFEMIDKLSKKQREQEGIKDPIKPVWQKMLLSDFTPEALAEVHKYNKRGIGVYVDELAGWFKNFNRYNSGSEMEFWLSSWSSKPINIDRKSGEPILIPLPFISVGGTIQNGLLTELAKENRTQNGFIDRILFVVLTHLKKQCWSEKEIDPIFIQNWQIIISNLLAIPITLDETLSPNPEILYFAPEAKQLLLDWQKTNTDLCNDAESEAICSIYSKLDMYVVRLALILELISWACDESQKDVISIMSVQGAIKLIEYFRKSAVKAHSIISNTDPLEKFPADKQLLYRALPDSFTTEIGLNVAQSVGVPERTFKRFLHEKDLFIRISRGEYEKRF